VIRHTTQLIAFSDYSRQEAIEHSGADPQRIVTIYLGVSPLSPQNDQPIVRQSDLIVTVGGLRVENLLRKGLLPFVQTAHLLPELSFIVVGAVFEPEALAMLKANAPANVEITGELSNEQLAAVYQRARIYVQASLHEGFGLSVAEAMLAGCVPVVTAVGSLPEVVGEAGIYAESNQPEAIAKAIHQALDCDPALGEAARNRILTLFPMAERQKALYALVDRLVETNINHTGAAK
jgi:glycosyltransferase involved in cell wall biosynthesis